MFDYRPIIGRPDPEESQQADRETTGQVGANHDDNCGPGIYAAVFKQLGNGDPHEPQDIAGAGYRGGMTTAHIWQFFQAHRADYPNWADIDVSQGGDVVAKANQAAQALYPMVAWFWSDAAAVVRPYRTGILHWCEIIADDGSNLWLRNPEWMTDVPLPYSQARAAYAGEFTVFKRRLTIVDPKELRRIIAALVYHEATGKMPDNDAHLQAMADAMHDDLKGATAWPDGWVLGMLKAAQTPTVQPGGAVEHPTVLVPGFYQVK